MGLLSLFEKGVIPVWSGGWGWAFASMLCVLQLRFLKGIWGLLSWLILRWIHFTRLRHIPKHVPSILQKSSRTLPVCASVVENGVPRWMPSYQWNVLGLQSASHGPFKWSSEWQVHPGLPTLGPHSGVRPLVAGCRLGGSLWQSKCSHHMGSSPRVSFPGYLWRP